jgi:hypothetical protein
MHTRKTRFSGTLLTLALQNGTIIFFRLPKALSLSFLSISSVTCELTDCASLYFHITSTDFQRSCFRKAAKDAKDLGGACAPSRSLIGSVRHNVAFCPSSSSFETFLRIRIISFCGTLGDISLENRISRGQFPNDACGEFPCL